MYCSHSIDLTPELISSVPKDQLKDHITELISEELVKQIKTKVKLERVKKRLVGGIHVLTLDERNELYQRIELCKDISQVLAIFREIL